MEVVGAGGVRGGGGGAGGCRAEVLGGGGGRLIHEYTKNSFSEANETAVNLAAQTQHRRPLQRRRFREETL